MPWLTPATFVFLALKPILETRSPHDSIKALLTCQLLNVSGLVRDLDGVKASLEYPKLAEVALIQLWNVLLIDVFHSLLIKIDHRRIYETPYQNIIINPGYIPLRSDAPVFCRPF